ncbi:hypothetical protein ABK040_010460 [Willaertia magna]
MSNKKEFILNEEAKKLIDSYEESDDEENAGLVTKHQIKQDLSGTKNLHKKEKENDNIIEKVKDLNKQTEQNKEVKEIRKEISKIKKKLNDLDEDDNSTKKKNLQQDISRLKTKENVLLRKQKKSNVNEEGFSETSTTTTRYTVKRNKEDEKEIFDNEPSQKKKKDSKIIVEDVSPYTRQSYSVSIAIPGSVISQGMSDERKSLIAASIARLCTIHKVNEIIIYNEEGTPLELENFLPNMEPPIISKQQQQEQNEEYDEDNNKGYGKGGKFNVRVPVEKHTYLGNVLYYLETPPHLRDELIVPLKMLQTIAQSDISLDCEHHRTEKQFVEGVVQEDGASVYIGGRHTIELKGQQVPPGLRVTVEISKSKKGSGRIVSSQEPQKKGIYWGYNVRIASCFSEIFTQCPYENEGYDVITTHSDFGKNVDAKNFSIPSFKHLLIVFGGLEVISKAISSDINFKSNVDNRKLFDLFVNVIPKPGTTNISVEEMIPISLSTLRKHLDYNLPPAKIEPRDFSNFFVQHKQ